MSPYTDDDLDRAVEAIRALRPALTEGHVPLSPPTEGDHARAVLDAVAADIARRERESIVAWLRMLAGMAQAALEYGDERVLLTAADCIEAHADQEAT